MKINMFGVVASLGIVLGLVLTVYAFVGESEEEHRAKLEHQIVVDCFGGPPLVSGVPQGAKRCIEERRAEVGLD